MNSRLTMWISDMRATICTGNSNSGKGAQICTSKASSPLGLGPYHQGKIRGPLVFAITLTFIGNRPRVRPLVVRRSGDGQIRLDKA